jgi:hypothetical protein
MRKKGSDTVRAAWITGCFGCAAALLAAIVGLVAVYVQVNENKSVPTAITMVVTTVVTTDSETMLQIINKSAEDICYLYIVPAGSETWGPGLLGVGQTIPSNKFRKYPIETGMYNLRAENCNRETILETLNTHLQGEMSWVVLKAVSTSTASSPETTLNVINNGSEDICNLYIVPSEFDNWEDDLLNGSQRIPVGQSLIFPLENGMYNLKAENCDSELIAESFDSHIQGSMKWDLK